MRHLIAYLLVICCLISACREDDAELPPVPANRTVLVYMIGDNSLSNWVSANIEKMMKTYQGEGNLILYIDNYSDVPHLVKLTFDPTTGVCQEEIVRTYEERNSASPEILNAVIEEVCENFPAESYGLLLWSHGTSWLPSDSRTRAFGQDYDDWLELPQLASALPNNRFDFILFDACYMGGIEVAYALRNKTKYLIASPTEVWEDGFPYDNIVGNFWGDETAYRKICQSFFDFYNSQNGIKQSGTISLIKTEGIDKLATTTREIFVGKETMLSNLDRTSIQCVDRRGSLAWHDILYDFDDYVSHMQPTESQYKTFGQQLSNVVLFEAHTESFGQQVFYRKFCGLSCYIPQSGHPGLNDFYATLDWAKAVY